MTDDYKHIQELADRDVKTLTVKNESYGASWRKRGGVGAFMMLARKWDRLETQVTKYGYDVFEAIRVNQGTKDDILDDIQDLRAYLLLVESHVTAPNRFSTPLENEIYEMASQTVVGPHGCPVVGCMILGPHTHPTSGARARPLGAPRAG